MVIKELEGGERGREEEREREEEKKKTLKPNLGF